MSRLRTNSARSAGPTRLGPCAGAAERVRRAAWLGLLAAAAACAGPGADPSPAPGDEPAREVADAPDAPGAPGAPGGGPAGAPAGDAGAPPAGAAPPGFEDVPNASGYRRVEEAGFVVGWRSVPSPIPMNEPFELVVRVWDADDPSLPLEDAQLRVRGWMPDHGHGMKRQARAVRQDDGSFRVSGLLFHMPGLWQLLFDVVRPGHPERVEFEVVLE